MIVIILNGPAESGKGTFLKLLQELFDLSYTKYSSVAWAKMIVEKHFEWDGHEKTVAVRELISKIKNLGMDYGNIPFKKVLSIYRRSYANHDDLFVTDVREPKEIQKFVAQFKILKIKCITIRIENIAKEQYAAKHLGIGDNQYADYDYDFEIPNNGTIEEFRETIETILDGELNF